MADIYSNQDLLNANMNPMRLPNDKHEFRFLIPSKAASFIIGKGGERIQRLRQQCNARLSIPDNKGPERIFTVEGTIENCVTIWKDCFFDVKELMGNRDPESDELDIRILYHTTLVGNVIGKGGEVIKSLKTNHDVSFLKVYPSPAPMSTDRVVQIIGNIDRIFECIAEIVNIISKQVPKGEVVRYDSNNGDESFSAQYGGWVVKGGDSFGNAGGPPGGNLRSSPVNVRPRNPINNSTPANRFNRPRPPFLNNNDQGSRFSGPGRGGQQNNGYRARMSDSGQWNGPGTPRSRFPTDIRSSGPGYTNRNHPIDDDTRKRPGQSGGDSYQNKRIKPFGNNQNLSGDDKTKVVMPRSCLDHINEGNGEKLWNIMNDSGAEISIETSDDNSLNVVLALSGSHDQITGAQYLLQIYAKKFINNL